MVFVARITLTLDNFPMLAFLLQVVTNDWTPTVCQKAPSLSVLACEITEMTYCMTAQFAKHDTMHVFVGPLCTPLCVWKESDCWLMSLYQCATMCMSLTFVRKTQNAFKNSYCSMELEIFQANFIYSFSQACKTCQHLRSRPLCFAFYLFFQ